MTNLRKFGLLLGSIFVALFGMLIPVIRSNPYPEWPWFLAMGFWVPALIYPKALSLVYTYWMKMGEFLGYINTQLLLGLLFFTIITPIGIMKRFFGNDIIGKQFDKNLTSYAKRIESRPVKHMEDPF
ncbi:MAG TPA: SxtJ family membrane protein [Gammaproteobacteria bacterium]|nr:SxtJ family membrane protein [Gammaproteobacteria bacterium]